MGIIRINYPASKPPPFPGTTADGGNTTPEELEIFCCVVELITVVFEVSRLKLFCCLYLDNFNYIR